MIRLLIAMHLFVSGVLFAQTPSFVPRTNNTGSIGTSDKQWGTGYFGRVYYGGEDLSNYVSSVKLTSFNAITGSVELVAGGGIQITTNGSQLRISFVENPTSSIGTNRVYFQYTGYTNYWTVPSLVTQIAVWAWGGGGGFGAGAGIGGASGFSYGTFSVVPSSVVTIVVGSGGFRSATSTTYLVGTRAFPEGGASVVSAGSSTAGGGGGSSRLLIETNIYIIAGAGGGGGNNISGGTGGGLVGAGASNVGCGLGGSQTNGGLSPILNYVLAVTNSSGSYLSGGNAGMATNVVLNGTSGGGGGGYYGGGGGLSSPLGSGVSGGGGSGYLNTLFVSGITLKPSGSTGGSVFGSELPEFISGVGAAGQGTGSGSGGNGLIVIGY